MTHRTAIPQYEVGFGRFRRLMDDLERDAPGLFLAGHFRDGISLGDCIASAECVAQRIGDYTVREKTRLSPSSGS